MSLSSLSVRRPVLISVIYIALALFGLYALRLIPIDLFPEIESPMMSVITYYPGASAEDVESKVSEVIEEHLGSIGNLEEMSSVSKENVSVVTLQFDYSANLDEAANDVRSNLDFARGKLPRDVDPPVLMRLNTDQFPIVLFAIISKRGNIYQDSELVEERILDPLKRVPGVGAVQTWNAPEEQLLVEVDRARLDAHQLTLDRIGQILSAENLSIPAGQLDVGPLEFAVRMPAEFSNVDELESVVLSRGADGSVVRLQDVARVHMGLEDVREIGRMESRRAIVGGVMKRSGANTVEMSNHVQARIDALSKSLPEHIEVVTVIDMAKFIRLMVSNLADTLWTSMALVIAIVFVFLRRLKSSLIVSLAIPISLVTSFLLLYQADFTLNAISMMAMALAIGMVVDNAIVVLENITRHMEQGKSPKEAAVVGAREMAGAITASTLTTVSVFAPLLFLSGLVGIMFGQLAYVIAVTIGASLLVALTLTPAACARWLARQPKAPGRVAAALERSFGGIEAVYARTIRGALRHRALVLLGAIGMAGGTFAIVAAVGTDFMPKQNAGEVRVVAELPIGTGVQKTAEVAEQIAAELRAQPEADKVIYRAGTPKMAFGTAMGGKEGPNVAQVTAALVPIADRERTDAQVADHIRRFAEGLPEIVHLTVEGGSTADALLKGMGKPLVVELLGDDFDALQLAAEKVEGLVKEVPGTVDVAADLFETRPEIVFAFDRDRASRLGVSAASAGQALRTAMYGSEVTRYRGDAADVDVFLRLREADRSQLQDLERLHVMAVTGEKVPLHHLGSLTEGQSPIEIRRKDKQRMLTVSANLQGRALGDVVNDVEKALAGADLPPTIDVQFGGDVEQQRETFEGMLIAFALGFALVYLVMAGQFESFLDPFIIMFSVPFAITGAFLFLLVTGTTLSLPAFLGLVILVGVVVNNAIVLVDYVNQLRRSEGMALQDALPLAAQRRLRPVLMTTTTTIFGMLPLAFASGEGSEMWTPMGRAAMGGLLVSTLVTLVLVPVMYSLVDRFRRWPATT